MEVFSAVWVILMLYCTEWFGVKQCFAVPVPTLTNYRHGYYTKNSWNHRQTRYPEVKYEQFVFPKQQEAIPDVAERTGFGDSSGKIFFPDEISHSSSDKGYHNSENREPLPVWQTHHRPSTAVSSSGKKRPALDQRMKMQQSSEDGSMQTAPETQQLPTDGNTELKTDDQNGFKSALHPSSSTTTPKKTTQEESVKEAVQEFYHWLKLSNGRPRNRQKGKLCLDQAQTGSVAENDNQGSGKPDIPFISDQSLVAGLKDQECPEGQIRLENGECRVKVEI